jgi:hypothetical protein
VTPAARRSSVSRTAGWIVPVALLGGVVSGTWDQDGKAVRLTWFREAGPPPRAELKAEVKRVSRIAGRALKLEISRS